MYNKNIFNIFTMENHDNEQMQAIKHTYILLPIKKIQTVVLCAIDKVLAGSHWY